MNDDGAKKPLRLRPGMIVSLCGRIYQVDSLETNGEFKLQSGTGLVVARVTDGIEPIKMPGLKFNRLRPFGEYPLEYQREALRRKKVLDELLAIPSWTKDCIEVASQELDISRASLFRWVGRYLVAGMRAEVLIPGAFKYGLKRNRLESKADEALEKAVIQYKNEKRPDMASIWRILDTECKANNIDTPSRSTLVRRIKQLPPKELVTARDGVKAAKDRFKPLRGNAPTGTHPLGIVQMDHTPVNLLCRMPSGRVIRLYLTLVIDVFSRMVLGIYLSPGGPSHLSAGMALYSMMTSKEPHLRRLGLVIDWPAFGKPKEIGTDSASEFSGAYFYNICLSEDICMTKRVREDPASGGYIERLMGRAAMAMSLFPGKTFSNVMERGVYESEENACMSYEEILRAFYLYFSNYHLEPHRGLRGRTPMSVFKEWMADHPQEARSLQPDRVDRELLMSLLPWVDRTIQRGGINWEGDQYEDWSLIPYNHTKNPNSPDGKYRFHYDPNDVSKLFWRDPGTGEWRALLARDTGMGELTEWGKSDALRIDRKKAEASVDKEKVHKSRQEFYGFVSEMEGQSRSQRKARNKAKAVEKKMAKVGRWANQVQPVPQKPLGNDQELLTKVESNIWEDPIPCKGSTL